MAELIDLADHRGHAEREVLAMAATPAAGLRQLRQKARLLDQCRDQAEMLFLLAQLVADIEALAAREETAVREHQEEA